MLEKGDRLVDVLRYELPYIYAYGSKRSEILRAQQPNLPKVPPQMTGGRRGGQTKTRTVMTDRDMLAKVRGQKTKG